jgi:hypothetical protein
VKRTLEVVHTVTILGLTLALSAVTTQAEPAITARVPIHFVISNPPCPAIPATVTGDGEAQLVTHATKNADGTYEIAVLHVLQGTATDSKGNKYVFHDIDHIVIDSNAPQPLPPYILRGTGKVALISLGSAQNIKLKMFVYWQINLDGSVTDLGSVYEGDITCDPSTQL